MKLFKKKKLYKIEFHRLSRHTTIIEAKNECQALKKFRRLYFFNGYNIDSIKEYKLGE